MSIEKPGSGAEFAEQYWRRSITVSYRNIPGTVWSLSCSETHLGEERREVQVGRRYEVPKSMTRALTTPR